MTGRRRAVRTPRHPFWKDERVLRWITTATALRLFIITVVVALVVLTATIIYFHRNRVQSERDTDRKIRDLACLAVKRVPPGDPTVDDLRSQYRCPAYVAPPPAKSRRGPTSTPTPTPTPRSATGVAAGDLSRAVTPATDTRLPSSAGTPESAAATPGTSTSVGTPAAPTSPASAPAPGRSPAGSGLPSLLPTTRPALPCPLAWLPCH